LLAGCVQGFSGQGALTVRFDAALAGKKRKEHKRPAVSRGPEALAVQALGSIRPTLELSGHFPICPAVAQGGSEGGIHRAF